MYLLAISFPVLIYFTSNFPGSHIQIILYQVIGEETSELSCVPQSPNLVAGSPRSSPT